MYVARGKRWSTIIIRSQRRARRRAWMASIGKNGLTVSRLQAHDGGRAQAHFWFPDGNVILEAGNAQFRVHADVLRHLSPVLQALVQAAVETAARVEADALVHGCPTVVLDDPVRHVEILLAFVYEGGWYVYVSSSYTTTLNPIASADGQLVLPCYAPAF